MTTVDPKVLNSPAMKIFLHTGFLLRIPSCYMNDRGPFDSFFTSLLRDSSSRITLSISACTFLSFFGDFKPMAPARTLKALKAPMAQYDYRHPIF